MSLALIFDLDGVLVDSHQMHQRALSEAAQWHGFEVDVSGDAPTVEKLRRSGVPENEIPLIYADKRHLYDKQVRDAMPPNPQLAETLAWIDGPIAVCSNSHRTSVDLVLGRLGILPLIDVVVSASEVGKNKPDPAIYLTTLQRLKVPCSGVVVFEDSDDGIAAAKGAGILNVVRCDFSNILLEVLKWV